MDEDKAEKEDEDIEVSDSFVLLAVEPYFVLPVGPVSIAFRIHLRPSTRKRLTSSQCPRLRTSAISSTLTARLGLERKWTKMF